MSTANFLDGVSGTGQDIPVQRELEQSGQSGLGNLETEDFLELLINQLQNQDPQSPLEQQEMMSQISQITQLQQNEQLSNKIDGITTSNRENQFISILGSDVNVETTEGQSLSGQLSSVKFDGGNTLLNIGGEEVNSASILSIGVDNSQGSSS